MDPLDKMDQRRVKSAPGAIELKRHFEAETDLLNLQCSIQVILKFQLIEKRNSCAHLSKCSAVWCRAKEEIRARTAFFMLKRIPHGRFKTLQASPSVRGTTSLRQAFSASF